MSPPERPALVVELAERLARAEAERDNLRAAIDRFLHEVVRPHLNLMLALDGIYDDEDQA